MKYFFFVSYSQKEDLKGLSWLSTHPESGARAKYILESLKGKTLANKTTLSMEEWDSFKTRIKSNLQ